MIKDLQEKLLQYLETTEVFIQKELPLFVEELLRWHFWHSLLLFVLGITLIVAAVVVPRMVYKKYGPEKDNYCVYANDWRLIFGVTTLVGEIVIFTLIGLEGLLNLEWLQILLAPRGWLVEYVMKLV